MLLMILMLLKNWNQGCINDSPTLVDLPEASLRRSCMKRNGRQQAHGRIRMTQANQFLRTHFKLDLELAASDVEMDDSEELGLFGAHFHVYTNYYDTLISWR
jgi:hypothetical protein